MAPPEELLPSSPPAASASSPPSSSSAAIALTTSPSPPPPPPAASGGASAVVGSGGPPSSSSSSSSSSSDGPGESVIRLMTRLSARRGAINLSQGFPNEPPPLAVRAALARAALTGAPLAEGEAARAGEDGGEGAGAVEALGALEEAIRRALPPLAGGRSDAEGGGVDGGGGGGAAAAPTDVLNQYSPPMGRPDVRRAVSSHYERLYSYRVDPERVTVTLGATEAVASALRTVGRPGDRVVIFEPYHELYPSQCRIFWMEPEYVTLREEVSGVEGGRRRRGEWTFRPEELADALRGRRSGDGPGADADAPARALLLNTPHNPTGKVFSRDELRVIVDLCAECGTYIITDEIYEHMTYGSKRGGHILIPQAFPHVADRTFVCNSMGKSASATGWRLGWCLHPPAFTATYRGIHDQMVVMSPHPVQYAALTYLNLPDSYFRSTLPERYLGRVRALAESLRRAGFGASEPEGAYYLFARYRTVPRLRDLDPWDAAMYMVEEVGVACVPGDNFYGSQRARNEEGGEYLRFAACRSWEDIRGACERIERALSAQNEGTEERGRGTLPGEPPSAPL